jgi:3-oxoacyl-[acyl-carrier protein] reductase
MKLAESGFRIAVNFRANEDAANEVVAMVENIGREAMAVRADVTDSQQVESMFKQVLDSWGRVDVLVNNAGIIHDSLLLRMTEEVWDEVINTNLKGAYYCTKSALKSMVRSRWGRIINIVSVVGIEGNIGQSNYAASKGALIAFSKSIAKEVASRNITVNSVAPGYIATEIVEVLTPEVRDLILSRIPQNRFGSSEDVANVINFLASDDASYITGETIRVDGGIEL